MSSEKKTRQRLTLTAMYEAIVDIDSALRSKPVWPVRSVMLSKADTKYLAQLIDNDPDSVELLVVEHGESEIDFESAVAQLLETLKTKFEEKKKSVLLGLDAVLERHHGALRGARSKIREKKA